MIVCSCHAVSDRKLRESAEAGLSPEEVVALTRAGTGCGCCQETVATILSETGAACGADGCARCPRRGVA